MQQRRFEVMDHEKWGLLIKTWATGKNYIGGNSDEEAPAPYDRLPANVKQFREVVKEAGVGPVNDDVLNSISFVRLDGPGDMVVRLASPDMIEASESILSQRTGYGLPAFYGRMFDGRPEERPLKQDERLRYHASRIGDYTLSVCL
jgi:hypothetical protein